MFKRFILSLSIVLSLYTAIPEAKAGLGIGALAGNPARGALIGAGVGVAFSIYGVANIIANDGDIEVGIFFAMTPLFIGVGALLEENAEDNFVKVFQARYPFIDNREALENLAKLSNAKLEKSDEEASHVVLRYSSSELARALETADISDEQFAQIAHELQ